ncbi:MAG: hypothetical protein EXQ70_01690 [Solirubrobacterales bacterium]|nr:hypothetical protein [Solirubrobacterales bacterium]
MQRILSKLSFANVISLIALFVALGGAAYAGTQIKPNSLGGKQINEAKLAPVCPKNAKQRTVDVCFTGHKAAQDWDVAERDCASRKLRMPSIAEALLVTNKVTSGYIWTDEFTVSPNERMIVRTDDSGFSRIATIVKTTPHTYRCVSTPR